MPAVVGAPTITRSGSRSGPYLKAINPEALMLGEQWQNAGAWMNGKEWDAVMNYNGFNTPVSKWITCRNVHGEEAGQCLAVTSFDQCCVARWRTIRVLHSSR
jgi:hypothetical protein